MCHVGEKKQNFLTQDYPSTGAKKLPFLRIKKEN